MIYYFSGTGNSRAVALRLAALLHDTAVGMTAARGTDTPAGGTDACTGLVFPVYAWGPPLFVEKWLRSDAFRPAAGSYVYVVLTCGDDIGRTDRLTARLLRPRGCRPAATFSIAMPNTYVALPGFDVDDDDTVRRKLEAARTRLEGVAAAIARREKGVCDVVPGAFPGIKSYVLRPFFNRMLTGDARFRAGAACVGCGACAKACPMGNIRPDIAGHPVWEHRCTMCMACYHACPQGCIGYGPFTHGKGRYPGPGNAL